MSQKCHQSKQNFKSFEQCGLNHLCNYTDLYMKYLNNLIDILIYKALIDQHEAVTLSNKLRIISNNIFGCESNETND